MGPNYGTDAGFEPQAGSGRPTVTDVLASGSLEDVMRAAAAKDEETPQERAENARKVMLIMMAGLVKVVEENHPDDEEIAEVKAEISRLAGLLVQ